MAKFFVYRPIVAIVISIIFVIVGTVAILGLPIAQYPDIVPPEININTTYVGADAQTVEQSVATPIEQEMSGVDNMNYMYSLNANNGELKLYVNFDVKTDPNIDQVLTQIRKSQADSKLPSEVRDYGVTVKKSTSSPLMLVALSSPGGTYDATFLANYAYINLNDQLTRVPGIASVTVFGAGQYAMRLWVKPDQLAKLNITVPEIVDAIKQQNTVNPAGQVGAEPAPPGVDYTYSIRAQGRLETPEEFAQIVLRAEPDGSLVRLKDVARIELGSQTYAMVGRLNGKPSAVLALYQLPGSNAIAAVDGVTRLMEEVKKNFPADLEYSIPLDTTQSVREGIKEILYTLAEALVLVIIVVFIFLQGWRATLIPALAVPVSLIGTFAMFPLLGFSINTIALMGLVLAIGLVVDDAIVVVEAVEHHIEHGLSPKEATLKAMEEVSGPVIAIALVLSAVFLPTVFIPGITGKLYQQFAVTIAISVIISAFNALTLSPALSALILKPKKKARGPLGAFYRGFNTLFGKATNGYVGLCGWFIRKFVISLLLLVIMTGAIGVIGKRVPGGFLPEEDQGYLYAGVQLPNAASLQRTDEVTRELEKIIMETPGVQYCTTVVGYSMLAGVTNTYSGFFFITLKPWHERKSPEEKYGGHHGESQPAHGRHPPGGGLRVLAAGHSGHRHLRRGDLHPGGPRRQGYRVFVGERAEIHGSGQEAAGDRARDHDLPAHGAADLRKRGPRQGAQAGGRLKPGLPHPAGLHGRLLRQLLQPLRPPVAGLRAGRGRLPHPGRATRPVLRAKLGREHRPALGRHRDRAAQRSRVHHALQPLPFGPVERRLRAGVQLGPGHGRARGGVRADHAAGDGI